LNRAKEPGGLIGSRCSGESGWDFCSEDDSTATKLARSTNGTLATVNSVLCFISEFKSKDFAEMLDHDISIISTYAAPATGRWLVRRPNFSEAAES
jgi:hypothetical protein